MKVLRLYLRQNKPAYVEFSEGSLKPEDAVKLIKEAGGLAVLAHPWCLKQGKKHGVKFSFWLNEIFVSLNPKLHLLVFLSFEVYWCEPSSYEFDFYFVFFNY